MNLDRVTSGKDVPNDINVIIEIPSHSDPVKYEVDKETGAMFVDRFMNTAMHYPCNYGYVPHTLSEDGDPVDVLVVTPVPLISGSVIRCRPIAVFMKRSTNIAPVSLSTSYFTGSLWEGISMMTLMSLGTSLPELTRSRFMGCLGYK